MKPVLVIGLGNPLMGDDGVGWAVAERLANDPRLPESVEVICGGTDLLRYARQIESRSAVLVLDAIQGAAEPGTISVFADGAPELDETQEHAHHLSAIQAIRLLQMTMPVSFLLLCVSISGGSLVAGLSPELAARLPAVTDRVLQELAGFRLPVPAPFPA
jgi:hydrogenase maturation protease